MIGPHRSPMVRLGIALVRVAILVTLIGLLATIASLAHGFADPSGRDYLRASVATMIFGAVMQVLGVAFAIYAQAREDRGG